MEEKQAEKDENEEEKEEQEKNEEANKRTKRKEKRTSTLLESTYAIRCTKSKFKIRRQEGCVTEENNDGKWMNT